MHNVNLFCKPILSIRGIVKILSLENSLHGSEIMFPGRSRTSNEGISGLIWNYSSNKDGICCDRSKYGREGGGGGG